MDARSGLCLGCARTLDEITGWSRMTPDDQRRIVAALPARKQPPAGSTP